MVTIQCVSMDAGQWFEQGKLPDGNYRFIRVDAEARYPCCLEPIDTDGKTFFWVTSEDYKNLVSQGKIFWELHEVC